MSEDEVPRRHVPLLVVAVLVIGGLAAWSWRGRITDEYKSFKNFCAATRGGEPWTQVKTALAKKAGNRFDSRATAFSPKSGSSPTSSAATAWVAW